MAPHSSTLAWKIPGTGEPGGLQSMGSLWVGHDWSDLAAAVAAAAEETNLRRELKVRGPKVNRSTKSCSGASQENQDQTLIRDNSVSLGTRRGENLGS